MYANFKLPTALEKISRNKTDILEKSPPQPNPVMNLAPAKLINLVVFPDKDIYSGRMDRSPPVIIKNEQILNDDRTFSTKEFRKPKMKVPIKSPMTIVA